MATVGLLHAHDRKGTGIMNRQTRIRCNKAIQLYKNSKIERIYITAASEKNEPLLSKAMGNYLVSQEVPLGAIIVDPTGHGTIGEITTCKSYLEKTDKVISISSWYHLSRIWFLWLLSGRFVRLACSGGGEWQDVVLEPIKFLWAVFPKKVKERIRRP